MRVFAIYRKDDTAAVSTRVFQQNVKAHATMLIVFRGIIRVCLCLIEVNSEIQREGRRRYEYTCLLFVLLSLSLSQATGILHEFAGKSTMMRECHAPLHAFGGQPSSKQLCRRNQDMYCIDLAHRLNSA